MDARTLSIFFLLLTPVVIESWQTEDRRPSQELRKRIHYHSKRHMLPRDGERKRRVSTHKPQELRKKPTGHLKPLQEDDMENDEVVSVAIGPPSIRPKYDKIFKYPLRGLNRTTNSHSDSNPTLLDSNADMIKNILVQLGREFVTHQINEDFVFGQYVGNSMKNLTNDLRLKMQHEILDLIVKYQKLSRGGVPMKQTITPEEINPLSLIKDTKSEKKNGNDTEEGWPDFNNIAKIVG